MPLAVVSVHYFSLRAGPRISGSLIVRICVVLVSFCSYVNVVLLVVVVLCLGVAVRRSSALLVVVVFCFWGIVWGSSALLVVVCFCRAEPLEGRLVCSVGIVSYSSVLVSALYSGGSSIGPSCSCLTGVVIVCSSSVLVSALATFSVVCSRMPP